MCVMKHQFGSEDNRPAIGRPRFGSLQGPHSFFHCSMLVRDQCNTTLYSLSLYNHWNKCESHNAFVFIIRLKHAIQGCLWLACSNLTWRKVMVYLWWNRLPIQGKIITPWKFSPQRARSPTTVEGTTRTRLHVSICGKHLWDRHTEPLA